MDAVVGFVYGFLVIAGLCRPTLPQNIDNPSVIFTLIPTVNPPFAFKEKETLVTHFSYAFEVNNSTLYENVTGWVIKVFVDNSDVASIKGRYEYFIDKSNLFGIISVQISGVRPGRTILRFRVQVWPENTKLQALTEMNIITDVTFKLVISKEEKLIEKLYTGVIFLLVITANTGIGTQVDLKIVKAELLHPVSPIIGMISQFLFMPLIAYGILTVLKFEAGIALGIFATGCSPGGFLSNIFTYLLDGNVSLSITMTLVSTLASTVLFPMWMFTLGAELYKSVQIQIPYKDIISSLCVILFPTVIGLITQYKFPRVARFLIKSIKYIMVFVFAFLSTAGVFALWWITELIDTKIVIASAALPYFGFILGSLAACIVQQDRRDIITIGIETGIQNTAIPILLLRMSLTGPEQSTSQVVPLLSSALTQLPLLIILLCKAIYRRTIGQTEDKEVCEESEHKDSIDLDPHHKSALEQITTTDKPDKQSNRDLKDIFKRFRFTREQLTTTGKPDKQGNRDLKDMYGHISMTSV